MCHFLGGILIFVTRKDDFRILFTFYLADAFVRMTYLGINTIQFRQRGWSKNNIVHRRTQYRERIRGWNKFIRTKALHVVTVVVARLAWVTVVGTALKLFTWQNKHLNVFVFSGNIQAERQTRRLTQRQPDRETRSWLNVVEKQHRST